MTTPTMWRMGRNDAPSEVSVIYMNIQRAEVFEPKPGDVCVSIRDKGERPAMLKPGWDAVVQVEGWRENRDTDLLDRRVFAGRILMGLMQRHDIKRIIVHCIYGEVRSRTVASVLSEFLATRLYTYAHNSNDLVQVKPAFADRSLSEILDGILYRAVISLQAGRPLFRDALLNQIRDYDPPETQKSTP